MWAMKTKTLILTLAVWVGAVAICLAKDNPHMGTWKLNEEKSKITPGTAKNTKVMYESAAGDKIKVTVDGVDADGKATHNEWTGKFDGKDHAVTGDAMSDMRSYKKVDDRTLEFTGKKDGKVVVTGRIAVSEDGKSRTVTADVTSKEKKYTNTGVYDKE